MSRTRFVVVIATLLSLPVTLWAAASGPCGSGAPASPESPAHHAHHDDDAGHHAGANDAVDPDDDDCLCCGDCAMACGATGSFTGAPTSLPAATAMPAQRLAVARRHSCLAGPPRHAPFRPPITLR